MTGLAVSFLEFLKGVIGRFPDLSVDNGIISNMSQGMDTVFGFIGKVNFFIPLDHMLAIMGLVYVIRNSKFIVFIINWIIRRIADLIP